MDSGRLRRKDTTKGPPLRILSLDGGGIRGYSMLIILQELMYRTYVECEGKAPRRDQIPKPCDHFDLIAGTGTGGLIAIMLGRLRLDIETCKEVYVRMTRRVFETDKTFAGIPYRSTLFKASKLEDAIRSCVREHTILETEGNDGTVPARPVYGRNMHYSSLTSPSSATLGVQRRLSRNSVSSNATSSPTSPMHSRGSTVPSINTSLLWGNPNALLYDNREVRTKTAVTAYYKGTPRGGTPAMLRSYDSRREPPPEFNCTIWEAGRATSATGLAFKPIQIGQNVFIDEGHGKFNPAPQVLDEATVNEWPGREVGVFVSVGTGKRPPGTSKQQHEWWEDFFADSLGHFAEARRRLIAKIEACETTHQAMLRDHLAKRNVPKDNYYRFNVEVGVGEFGMNEWNRLVDISTNTRMYLGRTDVQKMTQDSSAKLAKIQRAHRRAEQHDAAIAEESDHSFEYEDYRNRPVPPLPQSPQHGRQPSSPPTLPPAHPPPPPPPLPHPSEQLDNPVFELPAEIPPNTSILASFPPPPGRRVSLQDKYPVIASDEFPEPLHAPRQSFSNRPPTQQSIDDNLPPRQSFIGTPSPRASSEIMPPDQQPPPLPPKTPIPYPDANTNSNGNSRPATGHSYTRSHSGSLSIPVVPPRSSNRPVSNAVPPYPDGQGRVELPYPDDGTGVGPPPAVNRVRKPMYTPRS